MNDDEMNAPTGSSGDPGDKPFRVPSFDELMGFVPPAAETPTDDAATPADDAEAEPTIFSVAQPTAATPAPSASREVSAQGDWGVPLAQNEEDHAPLILPGFSPEPQRSEPLPPLFQADQPAEQTLDSGFFDELPPTQPVPTISTQQLNTVADATMAVENHAAEPGEDNEPPTDTNDVFAALGLGGQDDEVDDADDDEDGDAAHATAVSESTPTAPLVTGAAAAKSSFAAPAAPAASAPAASSSLSPSAQKSAPTPEPTAAAAAPTAALSAGGAMRSTARPDDYEKISVTGGEKGTRRALPWIIVGGGVLIALIASIFVINALRSPADPNPTPAPAPTTTEPAPEPEPTETEDPTPEPAPEPDDVPVVEVGQSWWIPITQWNLDVEKSQRLGTVTYSGLTDESLVLEIELAQSLPDSCAAAREGWGLSKAADGKLEAIRPMPRCTEADAAAVYDTIWGLVDHMAKSARPSE